jgi:Uma2 family endonuclease
MKRPVPREPGAFLLRAARHHARSDRGDREMADAARRRMTTDEFLAWAMEQPGGRYELFAGEVVAMAPERVIHAQTKLRAVNALAAALTEAGLRCVALPDGVTVRIDARTAFEPDALVTCERVDPEATDVASPVIVVEVVLPTSRGVDTGLKLSGYFSLPSVRHYLIVDVDRRVVVHHARDEKGRIETAVRREGALRLDPPGLAVAVNAMLPPAS